ncbi:MAG: stage III sporulation AC/AD family protein [Lachnospiraceae bacterium]|nr:stage III sporulation AC/AD family protein [Lachnospiraceae bacterium]
MEIIKIGLLGIIGVLFAGWFKGSKPEYTLYIGVGAAVLIFSYAVRFFYSLIARLLDLQAYMEGGEGYLGTLLKIVGITYICEFSAGICKDAGFAAVASQIEVLGKLAVMFAGLPVLFAVLEQIQSFL